MAAPSPTEAVPASLPRVLIAEGDHQLGERLLRELQGEFEVILAGDGMEAMERAARYLPDLFMIDSMITKMNGYQLVMMLRKNRVFQDAPIIFTSDKTTPRDRQYVERLGVEYFLTRPFDTERIRRALRQPMSKPGFSIRTERVNYRDAMMELSMSVDVSCPEAEARRVASVMKVEKLETRKDDRDVWRD